MPLTEARIEVKPQREPEPQRGPKDGPVSVTRRDDGIGISVTHDGQEHDLLLTEWNARRLLGMLSVILELPLQRAAAKRIKL